MQILDIASVPPGSRLARAVFTSEGKLLFAAGDILSESSLNQLRNWGIAHLTIADAPANETGQPEHVLADPSTPEDVREMAREKVVERFSMLDLSNPYIDAVFQVALERQGRIMLSKPGKPAPAGKPSPAFQTQRPKPVRMEPLVAAGQRLGTLPMVFHRLVEIINSPYASATDAADVIATDPALSAKLLRLVNSPFYGLPTRIDTISRAVVLVGTGQLVMLAMGATLVTAFKGMPVSIVDMQSFWSHSIGCGVAARLLAQARGQQQPESFFVAGLLHDISRLLIYTQLPVHGLHLLTEAKRRQVSVRSLEEETLGFTHDRLSAELLRSWLCPKELVERVEYHHDLPPVEVTPDAATLPVANLLSQALGYGSSGEVFVLPVADKLWEALAVSPTQLMELGSKMEEKIREMRSMLSSN